MVALLGEVPATSNSLKGLLVWRENQRRRSLLQGDKLIMMLSLSCAWSYVRLQACSPDMQPP